MFCKPDVLVNVSNLPRQPSNRCYAAALAATEPRCKCALVERGLILSDARSREKAPKESMKVREGRSSGRQESSEGFERPLKRAMSFE